MYISYNENHFESLLSSLKRILQDKGYTEVFEANFHLRPKKNFMVYKGSGEYTNRYFRIQVSFKETTVEYFNIECWFEGSTFERYSIKTTFTRAGHYESKLDVNHDIYESDLKEEFFTDVKDALKKKKASDWGDKKWKS